jgi:hypothetical protein
MLALANVLQDEGNLAEAEDLQRQALALKKRRLGPEHPGCGSLPQQPRNGGRRSGSTG